MFCLPEGLKQKLLAQVWALWQLEWEVYTKQPKS